MKNKKVSVIVTTKNEERNILNCLQSIKKQSYKNIQIIVVDNNSTDKTIKIAKRFTRFVYNIGPERSAQRNFGGKKSSGEFVMFIDADMILRKDVVSECVDIFKTNKSRIGGVIIPEESFGTGFWTKIKAFERSFYIGDNLIEAARFYPKKVFHSIRGFDESITGPEDWDLSEKVGHKYKLARINSLIMHNEGEIQVIKLLKKKYYYFKKLPEYLKNSSKRNMSYGSSLQRFVFFLRPGFRKKWYRLLFHPVLTAALVFLLTAESIAAGLGLIAGLRKGNAK